MCEGVINDLTTTVRNQRAISDGRHITLIQV